MLAIHRMALDSSNSRAKRRRENHGGFWARKRATLCLYAALSSAFAHTIF